MQHLKKTNDLSKIKLPDCVKCTDLSCNGHAHTEQIEEYSMSVLKAVENCCNLYLPSITSSNSGKPRKGILPGWNEYVKPYADENRFWNSVWRSEGRLNYGLTFERMKFSKNQYSYAVRRLKRCNDTIQN